MTGNQQRRFYFPNWNACAVANGWIMTRGRLAADLAQFRLAVDGWSDPAREVCRQVLSTAEQLAGRDHCAITAEHLRHACNWVASGGRRTSSADLTNGETQRVVNLFKLLADPDDLDAVMNWLNPEKSERASIIAFLLKRANEATLIAISNNAYKTRYWEELPVEKLRWLAKQLKTRNRSHDSRAHYRRQLQAIESAATAVREPDPF